MAEASEINGSQEHNPYDDLKLKTAVCDLFYRQQCGRNYYVEELSMIHQQCELMEQIRDAISGKSVAASVCEWDRETTRDPDVTVLSQVRSVGRLERGRSPSYSFASSKGSRLTRKATASDAAGRLLEQVDRHCSTQACDVLKKILSENKEARTVAMDNRRLKSELSRLKQQLEQAKQREIVNAARLCELNKKLQQHEAAVSDLRNKRADYAARLTELEERQVQLNRAEIACMVREKLARNQSVSLREWSEHTERYKKELCYLRHSIEDVISSPEAYSYRALAGTIINSLEAQQSELEEQSKSIERLSCRLNEVLRIVNLR